MPWGLGSSDITQAPAQKVDHKVLGAPPHRGGGDLLGNERPCTLPYHWYRQVCGTLVSLAPTLSSLLLSPLGGTWPHQPWSLPRQV